MWGNWGGGGGAGGGPCTLRPIFFFIFPTKTEKGQLLMVRAHFGHSNFSFFQQKRKQEILLILVIFTYFKVQTKKEKKKMVRKIDHFFIFLILKSASKIQKIL